MAWGVSTHERLKEIFTQACKKEYNEDGLSFDPDSILSEDIREDQEYHGIRIKLTGYLGKARIPVQVDCLITPYQPYAFDDFHHSHTGHTGLF